MNRQLEDLIARMTHQDPPNTNSADSVSFQAYRDAEAISDPEVLRAAMDATLSETNKHRRDNLYFVVCKIALNLDDHEAGPFLVRQVHRETDKHVLSSLLDRIGELPKGPGTDLSLIIALTRDNRWLVRRSAIRALNRTASPTAEDALIDVLATSLDPHDLTYANATLNEMGTARCISAIEKHLKSRKRDVKDSAQFAIDEIRTRSAAANRPSS